MMKSNCETFNEIIRILIESAPSSCILLSEDYEIVGCNQNAVSLFGVACKQDMLDMQIIDLLPEYQRDTQLSADYVSCMIKDVKNEGNIKRFLCARDVKGNLLYLEANCIRITVFEKPYIISHLRKLGEDCVGCVNLKDNTMLLQKLEVLAYTDALTGAYNRRYFMECAEKEFQKCVKDDKPFSIILLDIDFFKSVNDRHGHAVGDEVLKIIAARMCNVLKRDTIVARYGGEEFAVLLPNVGIDAAENVAWRINNAIQQQQFSVDGLKIPITISLGVCTNNSSDETVLDVVNNADKALYAAKNAGRNTVYTY